MTANARDEFPERSRVELTSEAVASFKSYVGRIGTVVGYGREGHTVRVSWDGLKTASTWTMDYLQHVVPREQQP
jgi:hypothetical protein